MSFSTDVKNEILNTWSKKACCKNSETYGLLLFGGTFSSRNITCTSENENVIRHFKSMLWKTQNAECEMQIQHNNYTAVVDQARTSDVFLHFETYNLDFDRLFVCEKCRSAFIRGAFLTGGFISDPQKEYHLEFTSKSEIAAWNLCKTLNETGIFAKLTERSRKFVVYLKESEQIEDCLTLLGATGAALEMMNTKIYKDIRNNVNRVTNFETANIKKTAQSSARQLEAIEKIEFAGKMASLPDELQTVAKIRLENPEASTAEIAKLLGLSRSGVHHRLAKLIDIAKELQG